ncbi:hypothetical protein ACTNE5_10505, partial [Acidaminococcus fermentans]|uniref:hypothetical protein n=1 Tax=Acidaminococcus fermentans TaxID=905 RepID=UPI003F8BDA2D
AFDGEIKIKTDVSKNRSRPCVVDELELTPIFDKEPKKLEGIGKGSFANPFLRPLTVDNWPLTI